MTKSVAIIGGGFYGSGIANRLAKKQNKDSKDALSITVFTLQEYAYSLPSSVRLITGDYNSSHITKKYSEFMDPAIDLKVVDKVVHFDKHSVSYVTRDSSQLITDEFDFIVLASGLQWTDPIDFTKLKDGSVEALNEYLEGHVQRVKKAKKIVIIGGGESGCEIMGELAYKYPKNKELILIHSRKMLLDDRMLNKVRQSAANQLTQMGVKVLLDTKVDFDKSTDSELHLLNGEVIKDVDVYYKCVGAEVILPPNELQLTGSDGHVKVKDTLQTKIPNIFAAGDVNNIPTKSLSYKDEAINVVVHNITQLLQNGDKFKKFTKYIDAKEFRPFTGFSLGPERGCGQLKLPLLGVVSAPGYLVKKMKSEKLFIDRIDHLFV